MSGSKCKNNKLYFLTKEYLMNKNQIHTNKSFQQPQLYRFRLMMGTRTPNGQFDAKKTVGMAYLTEGHGSYNLRLWTFLNERFFLVPRRNDPSQFLIFTKDQNRAQQNNQKVFANIVGNGVVEPILGVIKLDFDIFEKSIYMNLYPEPTAQVGRNQTSEFIPHEQAA
jgi:hypothetical protein